MKTKRTQNLIAVPVFCVYVMCCPLIRTGHTQHEASGTN